MAQFLGGDSGRYVEQTLVEKGLTTITQQVSGPTRICTTLLHDGGTNTELIDPSDPVSADELVAMAGSIAAAMNDYGTVALCGTQPPGAEALYERIATMLQQPPAAAASATTTEPLLLLDGFKQVNAVLGSGRLDVLAAKMAAAQMQSQTPARDGTQKEHRSSMLATQAHNAERHSATAATAPRSAAARTSPARASSSP